jgi:hypothetical protein
MRKKSSALRVVSRALCVSLSSNDRDDFVEKIILKLREGVTEVPQQTRMCTKSLNYLISHKFIHACNGIKLICTKFSMKKIPQFSSQISSCNHFGSQSECALPSHHRNCSNWSMPSREIITSLVPSGKH